MLSMTQRVGLTCLLAAAAILSPGCSADLPLRPTVEPVHLGFRIDSGLEVDWTQQEPPGEGLLLEFWVQNIDTDIAEFSFRGPERLCGLINDPTDKLVTRFSERADTPDSTMRLEPVERVWKLHEWIAKERLGEMKSGKYRVRAWLCGYEYIRGESKFTVVVIKESGDR